MISTGPMISDKETERLAKGFAFLNPIAMGFSLKINKITFDIKLNICQQSIAGFSSPNICFNTKNIEFGLSSLF